MQQYKVNIEYTVPEFAEIIVNSDTQQNAISLALNEFEKNYPEAIDPVVVSTEQLQ